MDDRLGQEQTSRRVQDISYLPEKPPLVCDLVDDPEGQSKVHFLIHPYGFNAAEMGLDPIGDASPPGSPQQGIQHSFLNIRGDDPARGSHEFGKGDCEVTHPGANVENRFPGPHMASQDGIRIMDKPSQRIVEGEAEPPWADMIFSDESSVQNISHRLQY